MDYQIIYIESLCITTILFLVLHAFHRVNNMGRGPGILDAIYFIFILSSILDSIWMVIDGNPALRTWHILLQVVYLSAIQPAGYLWLRHVLDQFPTKSFRIWKYRNLIVLPVLVSIVMILLSVRTGWIFIVDASGVYTRGPLHLFTVLLNFSYMLLASGVALKCRRNALLSVDKKRYTVAAFFTLPPFLLGTIQILLPPGLPSMQSGVLIGLLMVYGVGQNTLITRDALTDLPNRTAFERVLLERTEKYRAGQDKRGQLYIMEGDLNRFKQINDTYGHPEGDRALLLAADALREVFYELGAVVFRIGGDEFMMIMETPERMEPDVIRETLNRTLAEKCKGESFQLKMSLGVRAYDGSASLQELIETVDRNLYEMKKQRR